jgi:hypothetical protein
MTDIKRIILGTNIDDRNPSHVPDFQRVTKLDILA